LREKSNKVGNKPWLVAIATYCKVIMLALYYKIYLLTADRGSGHNEASRKRSLDAPDSKGSVEKRILLMEKDELLEENSENLFGDSSMQPPPDSRKNFNRRPMSNLGSLEQHHLGMLGYGKGSLGRYGEDEDSGDFVVDPDSEIFSVERQAQDLAGSGPMESKFPIRGSDRSGEMRLR